MSAIATASSTVAASLSGLAHAIDGDTLYIEGVDDNIRLFGIDAPENSQSCFAQDGKPYPCGGAAKQFLAGMLLAGSVVCHSKTKDRYGRIIAICFVGEADIGAELVRSGVALAYRKYSKRYVADELAAQAAKVGLWAGSFEPPEQWRHEN